MKQPSIGLERSTDEKNPKNYDSLYLQMETKITN